MNPLETLGGTVTAGIVLAVVLAYFAKMLVGG
jgi:predicted exporter